MPRDILAQTELLPFLPPVQRTVKIIPSEEIYVQTLFVEEWAARTINQTLFTPKGNRVLDIRLVQPEQLSDVVLTIRAKICLEAPRRNESEDKSGNQG